jgi:hypothetical protein
VLAATEALQCSFATAHFEKAFGPNSNRILLLSTVGVTVKTRKYLLCFCSKQHWQTMKQLIDGKAGS